jgi:hypothetical protein
MVRVRMASSKPFCPPQWLIPQRISLALRLNFIMIATVFNSFRGYAPGIFRKVTR